MLRAILGFFATDEAEESIDGFDSAKTAVASLQSKVQVAEELVQTQTDDPAAREEKQQSRDSLVSLAVQIVGAILSLAHNTGNRSLEKRAGISETKLKKAKDSRLVALCVVIHKLAAPLAEELKASKITAAMIASLKKQTDDYKRDYTKPRQAIAARKAATKRLPVVLRQTSRLLRKELDPLMVQFKETDPEFYARYKAARRIVQPASNPKKKTDDAKKAA